MGVYVYRRTSRVSNVKLSDGQTVLAVHLTYAYKPYIMGWDAHDHNDRMERRALGHVKKAATRLADLGLNPDEIRYAVVEFTDKKTVKGGPLLRFENVVPDLVYDDWSRRVLIGEMVSECNAGLYEEHVPESVPAPLINVDAFQK